MVDLSEYYKEGVIVHIKLTDEGFGVLNKAEPEH